MTGIRSVTLGTENIDKTIHLFHNIIGMRYVKRDTTVQFGDVSLNPGTRLQFVKIPRSLTPNQSHFESIGLRTPSDQGLQEYKDIFEQNDITFSEITKMNGHAHFYIHDHHTQRVDIYSNEHNSGVLLGTPDDNSSVNPLHQVQGLGPVIVRTNEVLITITLLTKIFNFELYAEYQNHENQTVTVLQRGQGGFGSEVHLYQAKTPIQLSEYGIIEQLEFTATNIDEFQNAIAQLKQHDIPYQMLQNTQKNTKTVRVSDTSGISFLLTLDMKKDD
ncbi:VOC family protein [Staphylococcus felis]|uniref:VOC family protein n=1 Tax=Staphylococcus felis TaxID=46127 RepID=A0ABS0QLM2_9STAP|nr:VOC family protein [Staphylococcus felis]MBH9580009.1 VOC family protein [Staphylococcus felis]